VPKIAEFYGIAIYMYSAITASLTFMRSTAIKKRYSRLQVCGCSRGSSRDELLRSFGPGGNYTAMNCKGTGSWRGPTDRCSRLHLWSEERGQ
jgi:hypothetical protein